MATIAKPLLLDETYKEGNAALISILENITTAKEKAAEAAASADVASEKADIATAKADAASTSATNAAQSYANADAVAGQLTEYLNTKEELTAPAVDKTLLIEGAAADSKVVGECIEEGRKSININHIAFPYSLGNTTINGIDFSVGDDGTVTMNGTSTEVVSYYLSNYNDFNKAVCFEDNTTYILHGIPKLDNPYKVRLQLMDTDKELNRSELGSDYGDGFYYYNKKTEKRFLIRIIIPAGATLENFVIKPMLESGDVKHEYVIGGQKNIGAINNLIQRTNSPIKLRLMQYNIGAFDYGRKATEGNPQGMADFVVAEKTLNYKKMLCKYRPDIIFLEEYIPYLDKEHKYNSDEVLFDPVAPFKGLYIEVRQIALKSHYPVTNIANSVILNKIYYNLCEINIAGRKIGVMTTVLSSPETEEYYNYRVQELKVAIEKMANYDYAIIGLDMNNNGITGTISSVEEGETLKTIANNLGWNFCNGGYLGWIHSYLGSPVLPESGFKPIDNIIYKDNGKLLIKNFEVLSNEYDNLSSDHVPVIADLVLY